MEVKGSDWDTAKHVFQVHGADSDGRAGLRERVRRARYRISLRTAEVRGLDRSYPRRTLLVARVIGSFGHEVRLIGPQFVKPYLTGQKNDAHDAAICEAIRRPEMRFVAQKFIAQQDLQALHHVRSRLIGSRPRVANQIRGLLAELGIMLPLHLSRKTIRY